MDRDEIYFLRDQVQRLNAVLAEYQTKYPPLGLVKQNERDEVPDIPWVVDKNLMSPLLAEYDANMKLMRDQLQTYEKKQKELQIQVDKLVAENNRLNKELKNIIESQLKDISTEAQPSSLQVSQSEALVDEDVLENLQCQLQMALQEKDAAMEMLHESVSEVERLERALQMQHLGPEHQALEHQLNQVKEQYVRTVAELNNEIRALQEELSISKNELKIAQNQSSQLRKTMEELRKQLSLQEHEIIEVECDKKTSDSKAGVLNKKSITLEAKLRHAEIEINQLKHDNMTLEQSITELQRRAAEYEQKAYEACLKLKENAHIVDAAVLEKDEALQREKLANEEISRLQQAIRNLLEEAGARTRKEVDSVREQCNKNLASLMEEIHHLELENSEKQAQIERAIREKRAAEAELEKIYKEGIMEGQKEKSTVEELSRRACDAERRRDEAILSMESMKNEMKKMEMTLQQEKMHLTAEVEQLRDRLNMMNHEFEMANNDRVKLTEKIDELQRKMVRLQQERDTAQRESTKAVTCLEKDYKNKLKEYEVRLQTTEDAHRKAMMELRQMLHSQQHMSAKWKQECSSITAKFEAKVSELREEYKREKQRTQELTNLLKESRVKTVEIESMLAEYTRNIKRLEERLREAEHRTLFTYTRSAHLQSDIVEERRQLKMELEQSLRESQFGPRQDQHIEDCYTNGHVPNGKTTER